MYKKRDETATEDIDWIDLLALMDVGNEETSNKDGDTSSRLPHHRIAAWARELMGDLQSIEDEDQGQSTKENGDDLGDSLAVKR